MSVLARAFVGLWPDKPFEFVPIVEYSGRLKGYHARIERRGKIISLILSKQWQGVAQDIQVGLAQDLLVRLFKEKAHTTAMDLYHHFLRGVAAVVPKTKSNPLLQESFRRVNGLYFGSMVDEPNLVLSDGTRTLGTYDYGTDTIRITEFLLDKPSLLDFVMYHEILHKCHKYHAKNGRTHHHTAMFREAERAYPNASLLEEELAKAVGRRRRFLQLF